MTLINKIKESLNLKFFSPYKRKYYTLLVKTLRFWKIPDYILSYEEAVDFAKYEIKDLRRELEYKEDLLDRVIQRLVDEFLYQDMSLKEAHREAYELAYADEDKWYRHLPKQYQTEKEQEKIFDDDLDAHITHDPIANASCYQHMEYELNHLKKGGVYETNY
ncbi:MAG: hypothetical protein ACXAAH_13885 [Promethearchaeota archaeon]|jgi:hypothetical protein